MKQTNCAKKALRTVAASVLCGCLLLSSVAAANGLTPDTTAQSEPSVLTQTSQETMFPAASTLFSEESRIYSLAAIDLSGMIPEDAEAEEAPEEIVFDTSEYIARAEAEAAAAKEAAEKEAAEKAEAEKQQAAQQQAAQPQAAPQTVSTAVTNTQSDAAVPDNLVLLNSFIATAYCQTGTTATGTYTTVNRTLAVNPSIIPYGTHVWLYADDGSLIGDFYAEDTGGNMMAHPYVIDIYMGTSYDACIQWGARHVNVYVEAE